MGERNKTSQIVTQLTEGSYLRRSSTASPAALNAKPGLVKASSEPSGWTQTAASGTDYWRHFLGFFEH